MTPEEKAKELVDKYKFYLGNENENIKEAVDLSLIAVDEIIMNILINVYSVNVIIGKKLKTK
jgi:hypothetical protein